MKKTKNAIAFLLALCMLFCSALSVLAKEKPVVKCDHEWDWENGREIKSDSPCGGVYIEYTCILCGATRQQEEIPPKHEWDWSSGKVLNPEAKCGEMRKTEYTCMHCAETMVAETEINHEWDWGSGKVLNPDARCGEIKKTEYTCLICGETFIQEDEIDHDWDWDNRKILDPDVICGEDYRIEYTCTDCGKKDVRTRTLEHSFDDGVIVSEPASCRDKGVIERTCTRCGAKENTYFSGTHTYGNGVVTEEPTDEAPGWITFTCTLCGCEGGCEYGLPAASVTVSAANDLYESISGATSGYRQVSSYSDPDSGWNGASSWNQYEEYGYFRYNLFEAGLSVSLTLNNGKTITVDDLYPTEEQNAYYLGDGYLIVLEDGQSAATQWKPGEHTVKATAYRGIHEKMCETTFTVTLQPNPIRTVTAEFVRTVPTDAGEHIRTYGDFPDKDPLLTLMKKRSEDHNRDMLLLHTRLTIAYADGGSEEIYASQKYSDCFTVDSVKKTADGYAVQATWCGHTLSYTVPLTAPVALPEKQAALSKDTAALDWKSVNYPADLASMNHLGSCVTNGTTAAFLYQNTEWEHAIAVLDETNTLRTRPLKEILNKTVSGEYSILSSKLFCVNGKFFLSVVFENGAHKAANGWENNAIFVSDDLKTFTELILPALPAERQTESYDPAVVYAFGDRFMISLYQYDKKNGGIDWDREHLVVTVSADLKTWSDPCSLDAIESDHHGGPGVSVLGTTARGVLLGSYSVTDATVIPYLEGVFYTTDFKTFVPVAKELSNAADLGFLGCDDGRGLINMIAFEQGEAYNPHEGSSRNCYSVSFLQFNENTLETVEKAVYNGTVKNILDSGNQLITVSIETDEGSASYVFTAAGKLVNQARLPYALADVADRRSFSAEDDGKTYLFTVDLLKDNCGLMFTSDAYDTVLRFNGPESSPDEKGYSGWWTVSWTEDKLIVYADKLYYVSYDALEPYLTHDFSGDLRSVPGDVSGDGAVTAEDARLALRAAVGLEAYAAGSPEFLAADVTGDNAITAEDARYILRAAVGLEDLNSLA